MNIKILLVVLAFLASSGCSLLNENDQRIDYKNNRSVDPLLLPPDLSATLEPELVTPGGAASYSDYTRAEGGRISQRQGRTVLPEFSGVKMVNEHGVRWLEIQQDPATLWPKLVQFWDSEGLRLKIQDQRTGIIETDWAENRADIPQDMLRNLLGRALDGIYSAATRDKYRLRIERGLRENSAQVFLTHRGAQEISQNETFVWVFRPSDPELEAEMLSHLLVYLGVAEEQAKSIATSEQTDGSALAVVDNSTGMPVMVVREPFAQAWRRVGLALDRANFTVQDKNREEGIYFVRYAKETEVADKPSFWSKLAFWKKDETGEYQEFRVRLQNTASDNTTVTLEELEGNPVDAAVAQPVLDVLSKHVR